MFKLLNNKKAVSPVIAVLLMVAIAVVAALITYSWVTGFVATTTTKAGHAIQIQGVSFNTAIGNMTIYVQNVGTGSVELVDMVFVNGKGYNATWSPSPTLSEGDVAYAKDVIGDTSVVKTGNTLTIRVVCTDGTFTEGKYTVP